MGGGRREKGWGKSVYLLSLSLSLSLMGGIYLYKSQ
jgi:hypothetical protein